MSAITLSSIQLFPVSPTLFPLTRLGIIRISGADRVKYLQGQVSCDVQALQIGQQCLGAHCDAKGKMWSSFRLLALEETLLLLTEKSLLPRSLAELKKYGVFAKVEIWDASSEYQLVGLAGTGSDDWMRQQHGLTGSGLLTNGTAVQLGSDRWLLLSQSAVETGLAQRDEADWWGMEILAGFPHMSIKHQGEYIPQMVNLHALGGISFTKGCYMGQETIARAKYRGANNRGLFILQGQSSHPLSVADTLEVALGDQWKRAGQILDCWQQGNQVLLTAVLPLDTEPQARFRCKEYPESSLLLLPLPYSLEDH